MQSENASSSKKDLIPVMKDLLSWMEANPSNVAYHRICLRSGISKITWTRITNRESKLMCKLQQQVTYRTADGEGWGQPSQIACKQ